MKHYFLDPIKSESDSEGFFFCLYQDGLLFHPEDDPANVVDKNGRIFTDFEALLIRQRIDEVYEFMDDPCKFILSMTEPNFTR
jgi:hypothetical protein